MKSFNNIYLGFILFIIFVLFNSIIISSLNNYDFNIIHNSKKSDKILVFDNQFDIKTRSSRDIWVDDFNNDIMIEELNDVKISNNNIELNKTEFSFTSTSDFNNGTKSTSNNNSEIETNTDNPGINKHEFELCSGKGDRFNFDDNDGDTWKWDYQETFKTGGFGTFNHHISNGNLRLQINSGRYAHNGVVSNFTLDKLNDFEVKIKINMVSKNTDSYFAFAVWDSYNIKEFVGNPNGTRIFYYGTGGTITSSKIINGIKTSIGGVTVGNKNFIYFKIGYQKSLNKFILYYSLDDISWNQVASCTDVTLSSNPYVVLLLSQGGSTNSPIGDFDEYELLNGKLINGYRTSGTWESTPIKLENKNSLVDTSIEFVNVITDKSEIDKIEWLENNVVKATYEKDIDNPASSPLTINENDLDSGSFNNIKNNFTIKLYLTSDGQHSPVVEKIQGNLRSLTGHLISKPIQLNQNYRWDSLLVSKTNTTNTDIKVSVLDGITGDYIPGFENQTYTFINLSTLDSRKYPVIKLRADFFGNSEFSPILNQWSVSWIEDYPVMVQDIPSDFSLPEDSETQHLINLNGYFGDYYDPVKNLTYKIILQSDKKHLEAKMDGHYLDFETKLKDWTGTESFQVECQDTGGLKTVSNVFEVIVTPVDDPPYWIRNLPNLKMGEDTTKEDWLDLDNYVSDIEDDYLDFKIVNHSDTKNVTITLDFENKVTIIPSHNFYGTVSITVQVFESEDESLYSNDTFEVIVFSTNDPPLVYPAIEDKTVYEDQWLNFTITALDLDPGDIIKFYSNITKSNFKLHKDTGNLSYHPTNDDIGVFSVNITIEDEVQTKGYDFFNITVLNVNNPPGDPVIDSPESEENFKINEQIDFNAGVINDIDKGDVINYYWDFDYSNGIQKDRAGREVNYTFNSAGRYIVTLTITDGLIEKSTTIVVNLTKSGKPDDPPEQPDSKIDETEFNIGDWLLYIVLAVVIVVILVLVMFFLIRGKKRSIVNKYIDEIDQAYDWARTNPTIGKEKLTNINLRLSNDFKNGLLEQSDFTFLEGRINENLRALGTRSAPGQIPTAAPLRLEPKPPTTQPPTIATVQPSVTPVQPVQPTQHQAITQQPTTIPPITQPGQKDVIKCFNCGNLVTITRAPQGEPTILHCPKCGAEGKV